MFILATMSELFQSHQGKNEDIASGHSLALFFPSFPKHPDGIAREKISIPSCSIEVLPLRNNKLNFKIVQQMEVQLQDIHNDTSTKSTTASCTA